MTGNQIKMLSKMKKLVNQNHRKFSSRKDRDYLEDLLSIGISEEEAWQEILSLSAKDYFDDFRPFYRKPDDAALVFKKVINGTLSYIKIKIEKYNEKEMTVCLSFHVDHN